MRSNAKSFSIFTGCRLLFLTMLILTVAGHACADFNVVISSAASNNGSWSGASPDVWVPNATSAHVSVSEIQTRLSAGTPVVISTSGAGSEDGDLSVISSLSWSSNATLTLSALRNVTVAASISASGTSAGLALSPGVGGSYSLNNGAVITLSGATPSLTIAGNAYTVINTVNALQNMGSGLSGRYALGSNIDASATSGWNSGAGFVPVGDSANKFTGTFDGLKHTITGLAINRPSTEFVGLFGYTGTGSVIKNVGLIGVNVIGSKFVGGLAGENETGPIENSFSSGSVTGTGGGYSGVGGLVGEVGDSAISNCFSSGSVTGTGGGFGIGGLVGLGNTGTITNSYSTSSVSGSANDVGGLVGNTYHGGGIYYSYSSGAVTGGGSYIGGLVGWNNNHAIANSYSSGTVNGNTGSLIGYNNGGAISNSSWLNTSQMMNQSNFTGWDFSTIWRMYAGHTYPLLKSFMTTLTITADNVNKFYDGNAYTSTLTNPVYSDPGAAASGLLFNAANPYNSATNVGSYSPDVYSNQLGYDISFVNSLLTISAPAVYSTDGLVSWWRGENNALDSFGSNNGTLQNGTTFAAGKLGQAFNFDGSGNFVDLGNDSTLKMSEQVTLSTWVKTAFPGGYHTVVSDHGPPVSYDNGKILRFYGSEIQFLLDRGVTPTARYTFDPAASNVWQHIAATFDGNTMKLYVNGQLVNSLSNPRAIAQNPNHLLIGASGFGEYFSGQIDEVAVYNKALTAVEITSIFNAGSAGVPPPSKVPNAFSFTSVANAQSSTAYESNAMTVTGITVAAPVLISGGMYAVSADGGTTWSAWTNTSSAVNLGDQVKVMLVSSALASTPATATLTIGGVSADYVVTTVPDPVFSQVSLNGLISAWRAENNALDSFGANHGTLQNGATFMPGKAGQAFSLDGANDVITVPAFDMGADWSVAGWFAPSACSSIGVCPLFARSAGNSEGLLLAYLNQNFSTPANRGRFVFDIGDGSTWQIEGYSSSVFSDKAWHHVVISKSGDTYALHVDGQQQYQATKGGVSTAYQSHGIRIGHWSYGSGETYTSGGFDEVMVFSRPLTVKEVLKLANPGLISMWKADSNALDSAGDNDGVWSGTAAYTAGRSGQAFSLDGSGSHVDMAGSIGDFGANSFTVAFWLNDSGATYPSDGYIIGKSHPDGGLGWDIRIKDRQIRVVGVNGWGFNITSDASLTPHVWHHVALSATGTEVNLYIDGALKGTSPRGTISSTSSPLRFGFATNYGGSPLNGILDDVSIYNRALSAAEIAAQYGLVSLWMGENNPLDSIGVNSGSPQGAVIYSGGINGGQAFSFNGSDSSIRVAAPSGLPSGAAPRTVAAWVKSVGPTSGTKYQTVFGYGSPGIDGGSFLLEWGGEANDRRLYLTGWNRDLAGSSQLSYGQWYHVAATYDGAAVRLYVNGIEEANATRSLNTVIGSNYAAIGTSPPNDGWHSFFNGLIDDLSVFDRVLGVAEIATLSGMVPDQFSFTPLASATLNTEYESAPVQITGLTYAAAFSVVGGQYAVSGDGTNWGAWSSSAGSVSPGSWVKLKATSSGSYGTTATATLTIGGVSSGFSVKTTNSVIGSAPGGNGSISCTSPVDEHGQSICTITPAVGYHLDTLADNGSDVIGSVAQSGNYTIADITANHDVIAGFAIDIYTVTATAGANGSISPSGALQYQHGSSSPQFSVTPDNGYHILSVSKDGVDIMLQSSAGFSAPPFSGIVGDHAIDAVFTVNLDPGPARIVSPQADYQTLQDAYAAVADGGEIRLLAALPGAPAFFATQAKTVRINGGYGSGYSLPAGGFASLGRLTVSSGKVMANGVKVR